MNSCNGEETFGMLYFADIFHINRILFFLPTVRVSALRMNFILIYARKNDLLFLSWLFNEHIAILANIAYNIISQ